MIRFKQWLDHAQQPGSDHVPATALPTGPVAAAPMSMIAYNLPQFHAIPENLPFCIDWANENWTRRWDGGDQTVLLKQDYRDDDPRRLADLLAPMLADPRYIRNDGRPLLMVYRPDHVPAPQRFFADLRCAIGDLGLGDPFLIVPDAFGQSASTLDFDAAAGFPPHGGGNELRNDLCKIRMFDVEARGLAIDYDALIECILRNEGDGKPLFPGVCPSWDNEARRGVDGVSFYGASPTKYGRWLQLALEKALREQSGPDRFVFISAWNEWAEGANLEPDRHYGYAYLAQTRQALERVIAGAPAPAVPPTRTIATRRNLIVNRLRSARDDALAPVRGSARS